MDNIALIEEGIPVHSFEGETWDHDIMNLKQIYPILPYASNEHIYTLCFQRTYMLYSFVLALEVKFYEILFQELYFSLSVMPRNPH